jgi:hypothetical protein
MRRFGIIETAQLIQPICRHCGLQISRIHRGRVWAHHDTLPVIIHRSQRLGCAVSHDPEPEDEA